MIYHFMPYIIWLNSSWNKWARKYCLVSCNEILFHRKEKKKMGKTTPAYISSAFYKTICLIIAFYCWVLVLVEERSIIRETWPSNIINDSERCKNRSKFKLWTSKTSTMPHCTVHIYWIAYSIVLLLLLRLRFVSEIGLFLSSLNVYQCLFAFRLFAQKQTTWAAKFKCISGK